MSAIRKIIKSESLPLELPIGFAGGTQIYFPDDQYIRDKKLMSISVTPNMTETMVYPDNTLLANNNIIIHGYLTLESYSGVQFVRKKPLSDFLDKSFNLSPVVRVPPINPLQYWFLQFVGQRVNWPKSFVEFGSGVITPITEKQYILFDVQFTELSEKTLQNQLGVGFNEKR